MRGFQGATEAFLCPAGQIELPILAAEELTLIGTDGILQKIPNGMKGGEENDVGEASAREKG